MHQGSTRKRSAVHNCVPTVTTFCAMWEGQALPRDARFGNSRCEIVGRRVIFIWSLIHGSSWSGLIKVGPGVSQTPCHVHVIGLPSGNRVSITVTYIGQDGVSNHQLQHCLLNRLVWRRLKKNSMVYVTLLCAGKSSVTGEFPVQMASNTEMFPFDDAIMVNPTIILIGFFGSVICSYCQIIV